MKTFRVNLFLSTAGSRCSALKLRVFCSFGVMSPLMAVLLFLPSHSLSKFVSSNVSHAATFGPLPEEEWSENRDYSEENAKEKSLSFLMFVRLFGCVYIIAMALVIHYLLIRVRTADANGLGSNDEKNVDEVEEEVVILSTVASTTMLFNKNSKKSKKSQKKKSTKAVKKHSDVAIVLPEPKAPLPQPEAVLPATRKGTTENVARTAPTQTPTVSAPARRSMPTQMSITKGRRTTKSKHGNTKVIDKASNTKLEEQATPPEQSKKMPRAAKGFHENELELMEEMLDEGTPSDQEEKK